MASQTTFDLNKSLKRALGGGVAGASAMLIQVFFYKVFLIIPAMNYQYRFGGTAKEAVNHLLADGGIRRFYRGIAPALIQGPLSRFGDTASNAGVLAFLDSSETTRNLPIAVKTLAASFASASFRIILTPIDTLKTTLQTTGKDGVKLLAQRVQVNGIRTLWYGALATASATFVGHYPWFATYNYMQENLPVFGPNLYHKLGRNAVIGFTSSIVSDCISNSLRVIKTYRQTHPERVSYATAIKDVVAKDGVVGLFGRGLKTRIVANGIQGVMFSVLWKFFEEQISKSSK